MERFVHYIVTTFNCGLYKRSWDTGKWMEKRLELFEKYTLPSLKAQTCQDFKWLLMFDPATPKIPDFDYDNIIITCESGTAKYFNKHMKDKWLITSRLDNDDYYEPTFVEEIQRCFKEEQLLIDVNGRQLDHKTGKFYKLPKYNLNSPFLSLIERRKDWIVKYKTVRYTNHGKMKQYFKTKYINKKLVVQVIHDNNRMNSLTKIEDG